MKQNDSFDDLFRKVQDEERQKRNDEMTRSFTPTQNGIMQWAGLVIHEYESFSNNELVTLLFCLDELTTMVEKELENRNFNFKQIEHLRHKKYDD